MAVISTLIEPHRVKVVQREALVRIVVAVDPAVTAGEDSDETGSSSPPSTQTGRGSTRRPHLPPTARRLGATGTELIKYATSGDVSGDRQLVVGYAGIVVR